jgi:hypothetical protein
MELRNTMIAYDPRTSRIAVGPWPDETGWSDPYLMTTGACFTRVHKMTDEQRQRLVFIDGTGSSPQGGGKMASRGRVGEGLVQFH